MVLLSSNGIPRVPPYFLIPWILEFQLRGSHPLCLLFPQHSSILEFCNLRYLAPPLSLVATYRIVFTFFSCRYVRYFSSLRFTLDCSSTMSSTWWVPPFGHPGIVAYLQLLRAFRC